MQTHEVTSLKSIHFDDAAGVLARSFVDDPGLLYVLPDPQERARLAPILARIGIQYTARCGTPLVTAGDVRGAALWFAPDADPPSAADLQETGISGAPGLMGDPAWARLKSMLDHLDRLHVQTIPEPHWYLAVLGVDPAWQRRGVGEALLQPMFESADRDNVLCYLEAPTEANALYYQRRGFSVVGETDVPNSEVHIWLMRRPASTRS